MGGDGDLAPDVGTALQRAGVTVLEACDGGEFGAHYAVDAQGRGWVLKTTDVPAYAERLPVAAATTARLRERGYPAPHYGPSGTTAAGIQWYLQERLRGETPQPVRPAHVEQLAELASRHADLADRPGPWPADVTTEIDVAVQRLCEFPDLPLAADLVAAADRVRSVALRTGDIAHGDFHQLNFLAEGDTVTGVFDWDFVIVGDWRTDLVVLAFWSQAFRHVYEEPEPITASALVAERAMRAACPDDVAAKLTLWTACRELAFSTVHHTRDRVDWTAQRIADVRHWWS